MFGKKIHLFNILGFSVSIDLSWLVIAVLMVLTMTMTFRQWYPELGGEQKTWGVYVSMGAAAALGLFASIIFHELCHSLVAKTYGLPMKGITLFIFGGVAEMADESPNPKAEFLMAIAGPLASVAVAGAGWGLYEAGMLWGWPLVICVVVKWIAWMNFVLAVFNMIPGFPLDGGRVLRAILWHRRGNVRSATKTASKIGAALGAIMVGIGILGVFDLRFGGPIVGLWNMMIGIFLHGAARSGYQQVLMRQAMEGEPLSRFMNAEPVTVDAGTTVERLVEDYVYRYHFKMFPVVEGEKLVGCVGTEEIQSIPREEWSRHTAGQIADRNLEENTIGADAGAVTALAMMNQTQRGRLMVVKDGKLAGILTLRDLLKFLSLKIELERLEDAGVQLRQPEEK